MGGKGRYIICPFFKGQSPLVIRCEGMPGTKTTALHFESLSARRAYRRAHCECFDYEDTCDVCREILKKYYRAEPEKPREMMVIT